MYETCYVCRHINDNAFMVYYALYILMFTIFITVSQKYNGLLCDYMYIHITILRGHKHME